MHKNTNLQSDTGPIMHLFCPFYNSMSTKITRQRKIQSLNILRYVYWTRQKYFSGHNVVMC